MKTIAQILIENTSKGMTIYQAEKYACQQIILNKIAKSPLANNILLKGGVVLFHITQNLRRTTSDLDFDFIRYDISDESIRTFIKLLNRYDTCYKVKLIKLKPLHQDDYKGKRLWVNISDNTRTIDFEMDIGVHTLLGIEQESMCFSFLDDEEIKLMINPPEQMFAEKLYSLSKHGSLSTRFKDLFDLYYFISNNILNKIITKKCIELILLNGKYNVKTIEDICLIVSNTFQDDVYKSNYNKTKDKWIDVSYDELTKTILDYIYSL